MSKLSKEGYDLGTADGVVEWADDRLGHHLADAEYLAMCVTYYEAMMFLGNHPVVNKLSPERILENERLRQAFDASAALLANWPTP